MHNEHKPTQALEDIKQMMDRGSRFVSLSGWSGVAAGICGLVAAWLASRMFSEYEISESEYSNPGYIADGNFLQLERDLLILAVITFIAAFSFAFLFTWLRSRKTGVAVWGFTARKVIINVAVPMIIGGMFILRLLQPGSFGLVVPAALLFYGLALINGSKFTVSEVRYLGYSELILGIISLWVIGYPLHFWAAGFGVLHILYGIIMWNRYERNEKTDV